MVHHPGSECLDVDRLAENAEKLFFALQTLGGKQSIYHAVVSVVLTEYYNLGKKIDEAFSQHCDAVVQEIKRRGNVRDIFEQNGSPDRDGRGNHELVDDLLPKNQNQEGQKELFLE